LKDEKITIEEKVAIAQNLVRRAILLSETTEHDIFFEYSPHCDTLTVSIHRGGWEKNKKSSRIDLYFDSDADDTEGVLADIDAIFTSLEVE
jgi:hypothetical protein